MTTFTTHPSADGHYTITLSGRLDATGVAALWEPVHAALSGERITVIDASQVDYCDGAGLALLFDLKRQNHRGITVTGLAPDVAALLAQFDPAGFGKDTADAPTRVPLVTAIGRSVHSYAEHVTAQIEFLGAATAALGSALRHPASIRWKDALLIAERAGVDALPIVALIAFLMGLIIAFQSAIPLRQYGGEVFVGDLVGLSMLRELGPLMTAILIAGRSGAAFAAELGTMKVNEEINALTTMGFDPIRFLVVTRVLAGLIVTPLLTIFADLIGILGGALTMLTFSIPTRTYFTHVGAFADTADFLGGLAKSVVFGILIAGIGCLKGLQTASGAAAVGQATTRAVVAAIIMIVVVDGLFALIYFILDV
ncbi:MAG: MlaE family lipid ABC transporter permease subunit [Betaproteobacteria bacterium]|nr:MlaE family lipid ABC transporter permease subunit [Betaproteobacteria bacterium]